MIAPLRSVAQDAFIDAVTSHTPGANGGFGVDALPDVVLGPPLGGGLTQGSVDVVSLGIGGSITLRFDLPVICDGPGVDFTIFENAFHSGSPSGPVFTEYGFVSVSQDGISFIDFPHDATTHTGLAGQGPVLSHPSNGIDPLDPAVSGGDQFDLSTVGLAWASYVRITDVGGTIPDTGDLPQFAVPPNAGFDLDAVAAVHACDPGAPAATATASPTATLAPATATPTSTGTPQTPTSQHDVSVVPRRPLTVRIRAGQPSATKRVRIKVRNLAGTEIPIHLAVSGCGAVAATVDFERRTPGSQDAVSLRAGKTKAAIVTLTADAAAIDTPDRRAPMSCLLTLTAGADVPGNVDPTPANNTTDLELRLLDLNDVP